jgi:hypothetical protein
VAGDDGDRLRDYMSNQFNATIAPSPDELHASAASDVRTSSRLANGFRQDPPDDNKVFSDSPPALLRIGSPAVVAGAIAEEQSSSSTGDVPFTTPVIPVPGATSLDELSARRIASTANPDSAVTLQSRLLERLRVRRKRLEADDSLFLPDSERNIVPFDSEEPPVMPQSLQVVRLTVIETTSSGGLRRDIYNLTLPDLVQLNEYLEQEPYDDTYAFEPLPRDYPLDQLVEYEAAADALWNICRLMVPETIECFDEKFAQYLNNFKVCYTVGVFPDTISVSRTTYERIRRASVGVEVKDPAGCVDTQHPYYDLGNPGQMLAGRLSVVCAKMDQYCRGSNGQRLTRFGARGRNSLFTTVDGTDVLRVFVHPELRACDFSSSSEHGKMLARVWNKLMHAANGNGENHGADAARAAGWNKMMHATNGNTEEKEMHIAAEEATRDDQGAGPLEEKTEQYTQARPLPSTKPWQPIIDTAIAAMKGRSAHISDNGPLGVSIEALGDAFDAYTYAGSIDNDHASFVAKTGHTTVPMILPDFAGGHNDLQKVGFSVITKSKKGPLVRLTPMFESANSVLEGADPGSVSQHLRIRLNLLDGGLHLNLAAATFPGRALGVGTSHAIPLLRLFQMAHWSHTLHHPLDSFIANQSLAFETGANAPSDATIPFPFIPAAVAAIQARVTSLARLVDVMVGRVVADVGYEESQWGTGTALVPIRNEMLGNPDALIPWTLSFLEAPFWGAYFDHTAVNVYRAHDFVGNEDVASGQRAPSTLHIPGPTRVIYVLVDGVDNATANDLLLPTIALRRPANDITGGGADVNILPDLTRFASNLGEVDPAGAFSPINSDQALNSAIDWWSKLFGNEADYEAASFVISDIAGLWHSQIHHSETTNNNWDYPRVGAATGDQPSNYNFNPSALEQRRWGECFGTATGLLCSHETLQVGGNVRNRWIYASQMPPTYSLPSFDPVVSCLLAARMMVLAEPFAVPRLTLAERVTRDVRNNNILARAADLIAERLSITRLEHWFIGGGVNVGVRDPLYRDHMMMFFRAVSGLIPPIAQDILQLEPTYRPRHRDNLRIGRHTQSSFATPMSRTTALEGLGFFHEFDPLPTAEAQKPIPMKASFIHTRNYNGYIVEEMPLKELSKARLPEDIHNLATAMGNFFSQPIWGAYLLPGGTNPVFGAATLCHMQYPTLSSQHGYHANLTVTRSYPDQLGKYVFEPIAIQDVFMRFLPPKLVPMECIVPAAGVQNERGLVEVKWFFDVASGRRMRNGEPPQRAVFWRTSGNLFVTTEKNDFVGQPARKALEDLFLG